MKNEVIEKVNKMGRIGSLIVNIGKVILIIALVISMIMSVVFLVLPKDFASITTSHDAIIEVNMDEITDAGVTFVFPNDNVKTSLEVDGISYEMTSFEQNGLKVEAMAEAETHTLYLRELSGIMLWVTFFCVTALEVFHLLGRLCKSFKECETPFTEDIVEGLRKLAFAIIPMAIVGSTLESAMNSVFTGNWEFVIGVDLTIVILILLIFMLASIFRYGAMLQQESDETL